MSAIQAPPAATNRPAFLAAALAFASTAVTLYWLAGGTWLLDTVGGEIEALARERSAGTFALGGGAALLKAAAGLLALALVHPFPTPLSPRLLARLALTAGVVLTLYGGVLVIAGALVLSGVIDPSGPVDEHALRWHVFFWDAWFVVWGATLTVAARRARHPIR